MNYPKLCGALLVGLVAHACTSETADQGTTDGSTDDGSTDDDSGEAADVSTSGADTGTDTDTDTDTDTNTDTDTDTGSSSSSGEGECPDAQQVQEMLAAVSASVVDPEGSPGKAIGLVVGVATPCDQMLGSTSDEGEQAHFEHAI